MLIDIDKKLTSKVRPLPYDLANGLNTIEVLKQIRAEFPDQTMTTIWDGVPYHRLQLVNDRQSPTFTCL